MKNILKPIAAAVSLALISVTAHAQLAPPAQGSTAPAAETGLFLEVYNSSTNATEVVNLSYNYSDISDGNEANLNNASLSPLAYTTGVANPTGAAGTVSQLNFGDIGNISAFASNSAYMVVSAANSGEQGNSGLDGTAITSSKNPSAITTAGQGTLEGSVETEVANWVAVTGSSGTFFDSSGSTNVSANNGPMKATGNFNQGTLASVALNTAAAFYDILANNTGGTVNGLANNKTSAAAYNGFWYLNSTTGDLTYNLVESAGTVPLPAAIWLFGSGLLGLAGVGRRRAV